MSLSKFDISHLLRGDMVRRMTAFVLVCVMAFSLAKPMEAKAVVVDGTSAVALGTAAAKVWLTSTGTTLTVLSGGANAGTAAISTAASAYATATGAAASGDAFLSAVGAGASVSGGSLILTAAAVALLAGFAYWCYQEYINEDVSVSGSSSTFYAGGIGDLKLCVSDSTTSGGPFYKFAATGTPITKLSQTVRLGDNVYLRYASCSGTADGMKYAIFTLVDGNKKVYSYGGKPVGIIGGIKSENFCVDAEHPIMFGYHKSDSSRSYFRMYLYDTSRSAYVLGDSGFDSTYYNQYNGIQVAMLSNILGISQSLLQMGVQQYNYFSETGYTPLPEPNEHQELVFENIIPSGTLPEMFPSIVGDSFVDGSLSPNTPVVKYESSDVVVPETPPVDVPFLPDSLVVPWHYVVQTIKNSTEFIGLFAVVVSNLLPSSMQAVIWAAVVMLVLFGLIRRFLQ